MRSLPNHLEFFDVFIIVVTVLIVLNKSSVATQGDFYKFVGWGLAELGKNKNWLHLMVKKYQEGNPYWANVTKTSAPILVTFGTF